MQRTADANLAEAIRRNLADLGYSQVRQLRIDVEHGQVSLSGKLSRFYLLQVAQSAAMKTPGVTEVTTNVSVCPVDEDASLLVRAI